MSDQEFAATVVAKVGPVQAKFNGNVTLSNLNPPESYTISGEGKGGAGFAKAERTCDPGRGRGHGADLHRQRTSVALAQLGSRLIDGTAKKMADEFFNNFSQQVAGPAPAAALHWRRFPRRGCPSPPESLLQNRFVWASAAIVLLMILCFCSR